MVLVLRVPPQSLQPTGARNLQDLWRCPAVSGTKTSAPGPSSPVSCGLEPLGIRLVVPVQVLGQPIPSMGLGFVPLWTAVSGSVGVADWCCDPVIDLAGVKVPQAFSTSSLSSPSETFPTRTDCSLTVQYFTDLNLEAYDKNTFTVADVLTFYLVRV